MIRYLKEDDVEYLLRFYPSINYSNSFLKAAEMIADRFFRCPSLDLIRGLASLNSTVYKYRWNHSSEILKFINFHGGKLGFGFHFSEIPFLFTQRWSYVDKEEYMLSDALITAWVSFASSGSPEIPISHITQLANTQWPSYTKTGTNIVFQTPVEDIHVENENSSLDAICKLWSQLESRRPYIRDFYKF
jgi:carboxylesterase type B